MRAATFAGLLAAGAVLCSGSALGGLPRSIQGTYTRYFSTQDFPRSEEPFGTYAMRITATAVVWTAKGLGVLTEQAKVNGQLLLVRDKPGSLGRLCAVDAWGSYRYKARGTKVTFVKVKDPCTVRAEVLAKTWTRK